MQYVINTLQANMGCLLLKNERVLFLIVYFKLWSFSVKVTCGFLDILDTETMEGIVKITLFSS